MASIRKDILLEAHPEEVWSAVRDFGALHERLAKGFVVDCHLDGDARVITFANGVATREVLVGVNDAQRRLAYAILQGKATHYHASVEVVAEGTDRSRLIWTVDVLPNELAGYIAGMMEQGAAAIKHTLEERT